MPDPLPKIDIKYFAMLREERGCGEETVETAAGTPAELYSALRQAHGFKLPQEALKVAINGEFREWDTPLADQDSVVFIPPVAGG